MEIKSLADGKELNNETWNDFIERLKYQHQGEGVDWHGTANPVFTVREKVSVIGSENDNIGIYCDDNHYNDVDDTLKYIDEDEANKIIAQAEEDSGWEWNKMMSSDRADAIVNAMDGAYVYFWKWDYKTVNTHLTRESAERFIKRRQHGHGELSVYVESAYWCWELRTIIDAMLDGKIKYIGDE